MVKPSKSSRCSGSSDNPGKKKNKFSVYEFNLDDERVEKDSQKLLSKFKTKNSKFWGSPVDKYSFLHSFAQGAKTCGSYSKNELLNIEDSDDNAEEMICTWDAAKSSILSNYKSSVHSPIHHLNSEYYSPGARSCLREGIKSGGRITYDTLLMSSQPQTLANNQPLCVDSDDDQGNENLLPISVDSDDDCRMELRSSISASCLARNKGSLEEPLSHYSSSTLDVEPVVIVNPDIITFGEMYSTSASLTFSDRYIKLEGSTLDGMKNYFSFNWSISDIAKIESSWYGKVETARVDLYLNSGNEKLAIIDNKVSEVVKLNFAVRDPCWSERQEAIESLNAIYKATWNTVIDSSKAFEGIIYPQGDPDAVSISMKDIQLLQPATFINDTIIDFYIKYLEQKLKPKEKPRFHFFNSFFFRKLVDLDKTPSAACEGRAAFQRVCKWTRKVNLFEKDYLFIPVNFSLHWSLIVICHPGEVAYYEDKEMEKSLKVPCILHMDSIKGSHRGLKNLFQSYLLEEWRERHNELSEDVFTKFLNLPFISLELPQQENSFDCGLFLLYFVERFLEEAPVNFHPYTAASKFLNKEWFPPAEASSRRGYIKNILYRIVNDNVQEDPPVTNYYDSSCNEIEGGIGKELLQEICNEREACQGSSTPNANKNLQITSQKATPLRSLRHSRGLSLVPGDSLGQKGTTWSIAEGTYQHCWRPEPVKRFCNIMSPIEEEETKGKQTSFSSNKASSRLADLILAGSSIPYEYEVVEPTSETVTGNFPSSLEMQDEDNLVPEVLLVSASAETTGGNESSSLSSEELFMQVVEDSYESGKSGVNDNGKPSFREAKSLAMSDLEVDSPYGTDVKAYNLQPFARSVEEQDIPRSLSV